MGKKLRLPIRSTFTVWLFLAATGFKVEHCHAHAERGHTHGYGWLSLPSEKGEEPGEGNHKHFILFGIELSAELDDASISSASAVPALTESTALEVIDLPRMELPVSIAIVTVEDTSPVFALPIESLCAFARLDLCGVRRI